MKKSVMFVCAILINCRFLASTHQKLLSDQNKIVEAQPLNEARKNLIEKQDSSGKFSPSLASSKPINPLPYFAMRIDVYNDQQDQNELNTLFAQAFDNFPKDKKYQQKPGEIVNILRVDNQFAGCIIYSLKEKDEGWIDFMAINPKWQGIGFGHILLSNTLFELKKMGAKKVSLNTLTKTRKFYSKNGFEQVEVDVPKFSRDI